MSARIPTACLALAALLGLLCGGPAASAKPPDLPADQEILCAPETAPPAETTPAPAGVDVQAAAAWCQALRTAERCLLCGAHPLLALVPDDCLLAAEYEEAAAAWLAGRSTDEDVEPSYTPPPGGGPAISPPQGMPTEVLPPGPVRPAPHVAPPADRFTCPYLREQDAREHRTQACPLATPSDVVGNLHKLEEARKLMEQGDYYRDSGRPESAALYYDKARRLCPGSRYEAAAAEQLRLLAGRPRLIRTEFDVAGLFDEGQDSELIQRIVTSVHPQSWGLMGGPGRITYDSRRRVLIVYQTPDVQEQVADFLAALRRRMAEEEQAVPPGATEQPANGNQSIAPADEGQIGPLLEACQRALHAGRYARAESLARRALELDADAVLDHPLVYKEHLLTELAAKVGHPVVVCPGAAVPAEDPLPVPVDESSGGAEEAEPAGDQGSAAPRADWWRDLVDLVRSAACAEVEGKPLASRGCCRVPLGCVTGELSWDNRGEHGSFTLTLQVVGAPAPSAGPRPQDGAKAAAPRY